MSNEVAYQLVPTADNFVAFKPVKPRNKLDSWVAWEKASHMFTEIYCIKYLVCCMQLL